MSYSRIIKSQKLHSQRVFVGAAPPDPKNTGVPFSEQDGNLEDGYLADEFADGHGAVSRGADAQTIVLQAKLEAEILLREASEKTEQTRQQANQEGFAQGYADGIKASREEASEHIGRIAGLAASVTADIARVLHNSEETIILLVMSVCEKVIQRSLARDRTQVAGMVKWALDQVDAMEALRVRVNPEDLEVLRAFWDAGQLTPPGSKIELAADPHVQPGGCIIDTNNSLIDAQISTKLSEIEQAFRSELSISEADE